MKALSIKQPWAWLICVGYKDIENRNWATEFRGRVYVHAGKRFDDSAFSWLLLHLGMAPMHALLLYSNLILRGAIIGEVDIIDCVTKSESPWFVSPYGFLLRNPVLYEHPLLCKGRLRFFEPEF